MDEQQPQQEQEQREERKSFYIPHEEKSDKKKMAYLFVITFGVAIFFFTVFLKGISPKTDIDIGENAVNYEQNDDFNIRAQIDQRLRMIKNDEDLPGVSGRDAETPQDVVSRLKAMNEGEQKEEKVEEKQEPSNTLEPVHLQPAPVPAKITKVYVGQFSDMQSAVDMQSDIMSSGIVSSPVIKDVNGYFTVQVGVFSSYDSAKKLASQLQQAGFFATVR